MAACSNCTFVGVVRVGLLRFCACVVDGSVTVLDARAFPVAIPVPKVCTSCRTLCHSSSREVSRKYGTRKLAKPLVSFTGQAKIACSRPISRAGEGGSDDLSGGNAGLR